MAKDTYDAIIIGAGHNGLTLGSYLARSGLEVLVLERRHEEGGGLCSEEVTQAGFVHNIHANYHTFVDMAPPVNDLDVRGHGIEYVRPDVQMASIFDDGTAITIHTDMEKTVASMARFNEEDAETFRRLHSEAHGFVDLLLGTLMYQPPLNVKELTKALGTFGVEDRSEFLSVKLRRESIDQFLNRHFKDDRIKAHLAFHGAVCSYTNDVKGLAIGYPLLIGKIDNWHLCLGGSHRLAHALWRDLAQHGGVMWSDAEVTNILVDGTRAVGVRMADGTEMHARKLVASTVSVEQTFLEFLDPKDVPEQLAHNVKTKIQHKDWSLFSVHLAMNTFPEYVAAEFDPDVNRAWVVNLGIDSPERLNQDWARLRRGELVEPQPNAAVNSIYDPTDAPPGCTTGLLRQFAPFRARRRRRGRMGQDGPLVRAAVHRRVAPLRAEPHRRRHHRVVGLHTSRHRPQAPEHDPGRLDDGRDQPRQHARRAAPARARPVPHPDRGSLHGRIHPAPPRLHHLRARLQRAAGHRRRPRHREVVGTRLSGPPRTAVRGADRPRRPGRVSRRRAPSAAARTRASPARTSRSGRGSGADTARPPRATR